MGETAHSHFWISYSHLGRRFNLLFHKLPYPPLNNPLPGVTRVRLFLLLCLSDAAASKNMIATSEPARPAE